MAETDGRIARWDHQATAGTTQVIVFTAGVALTSLSVYTGGTISDVDDLTGATEHVATLSTTTTANDTATVNVAVPAGSTPLRLVVDGVVQSVGRLIPRTTGTKSSDNTITLTAGEQTFALTFLGGVAGSALAGLAARVAALEAHALTIGKEA